MRRYPGRALAVKTHDDWGIPLVKRLILVLILVVLGGFGFIAASGEGAKEVYYDCNVLGKFKLVVPWFGPAEFFEVTNGQPERQPSVVDQKSIRFWLNEKDRLDNPEENGGGMVIDRETQRTGVNKCDLMDKPPV